MNIKNPFLVKICGLTTPDDLDAAIAAGADLVGFVLVESPRRIAAARARLLGRRVPAGVRKVAVFRHLDAEAVAAALEAEADLIQAVGDAATFTGLLRPNGPSPLPCLLDGPDLAARVEDLRRTAPLLLVDGAKPGTGGKADWSRAADAARTGPVLLAGGLTPENVATAIAAVRPAGVDVCSGVERCPGEKDAAKLRAFVEAARAAAREIGS